MAKSSSTGGAKKAPATAKKAPATAKKAPATAKKATSKKAPAAKQAAAPPKKASAKKTSGSRAVTSASSPKKQPVKASSRVYAEKTTKKKKKAAAVPAAATRATNRSTRSNSVAPPAASRPTEPPFDAKFLERQHEALVRERATYTRQAQNLQAEADSLVADFEPGDVQFDEESGEGDTLNIERERDLALSAQARAQVEEIDHALAKFALGTYGICEVSGEPVPEERLEAIPWARQRVQYKTGGLGRR